MVLSETEWNPVENYRRTITEIYLREDPLSRDAGLMTGGRDDHREWIRIEGYTGEEYRWPYSDTLREVTMGSRDQIDFLLLITFCECQTACVRKRRVCLRR